MPVVALPAQVPRANMQLYRLGVVARTKSDVAAIKKIVDTALINAVNQSTKKCSDAAVVRCGPEADLAHKIAEDVERARYALIGNLTSMR